MPYATTINTIGVTLTSDQSIAETTTKIHQDHLAGGSRPCSIRASTTS